MKTIRKSISTLFFIVVFVPLFLSHSQVAHAAYSGSGTGVEGDPYQITTCSQIIEINIELGAKYLVMNDLDCSSDGNTIIVGNTSNPFQGVFDGGGHSININMESHGAGTSYIGLFSLISNATVKNLAITGTINTDSSYVGSVAGGMVGNSLITKVSNYANIIGGSSIGGIVGLMNGGNITNVHNSGNITVNNGYFVAGIVGLLTNGISISNSYNRGIITGSYHVGGILGQRSSQDTLITNSFNVGKVLTNQTTFFWGGLWGNDAWSDSSILASGYTNNYFDVSRSSRTQCGYDNGGHAIYPVAGQCLSVNIDWSHPDYFKNNNTREPMASWDFSTTWYTVENGYPALAVLGQTDNVSVNDVPTAPSVPRNLTTTQGATSITLYWEHPADDGGATRTSYIVMYKESASVDWILGTAAPSQTSWTITDLLELTQYDVGVLATNSVGQGPSATRIVSTSIRPGIPTNLIVTQNADNQLNVDLNWTAPSAGSNPIDYYSINMKKSSETWDDAVISSSFEVSYIDFGWDFQYETSYDFRVQAVSGSDYSDSSNVVTYTTPSMPEHHISTCQELQDLNDQFDENNNLAYEKYYLDNDIDCAETETWNEGRGFIPISFFSGVFDGQNYTISNLHMYDEETDGLGIFQYLDGATILNLKIDNANVLGYYAVGILSGYIDEGSTVNIGNVQITNSFIEGYSSVGALTSEVLESATLNVYEYIYDGVGLSNESLGAVAGYVDYDAAVNIMFSEVTVDFQGEQDDSYGFGGFIGYTDGNTDIYNSTASGIVTADGAVGGFIGYTNGDRAGISTSSSSVSCLGYNEVGGIIGFNDEEAYLEYVTSSSTISSEGYRAGGLIGYGYYTEIDHSSNSGSVSGQYRVGGLVGSGEGVYITSSTNSGNIEAVYDGESTFFDQKGVGGLIGIAWNVEIEDSFNSGQVTGTGKLYVGGLIGASGDLRVSNSYNTGNIFGDISYHDYNGVGGLIGAAMASQIDNSYNQAMIEGKVSIGGIIGYGLFTSISNSYNSGEISSSDYESIGGLIGSSFKISNIDNYATLDISNSFNTGEISDTTLLSSNLDGDGAVIGVFETTSMVTLTNNWWYNAMSNGIGMSDYVKYLGPTSTDNTTNISVADEVVGQYQKAEYEAVFIDNNVNSPHDLWDFSTIWDTQEDGFPIFNYTLDAQLPVITILGDNPAHINKDAVYTDAGATATDEFSGDLTEDIVVTNLVNTAKPASYKVLYTVDDDHGNRTMQTRTVIVDSFETSPTPTNTVAPTTIVPTTVIPTTVVPTQTSVPTSTPRPTNRVYPTATEMPMETPTQTPTVMPTKTTIVLNDYPEFLDGSGKLTPDLNVGQVITFYVDQNAHKATITNISGDTVTVTFSSESLNVTFNTGETKSIDVNADGKDDIRVTLRGVVDGEADLVFADILGESTNVTPTATPMPTNTTDGNNNFNYLWICVMGILLLTGTLIVINVKKRKID